MLHSIVAVCLVGLGLSIKALPPAGEDPAAREDQLGRADCREGLLIFEAANWLEKCDAITSGGALVPQEVSHKEKERTDGRRAHTMQLTAP